MTRAALGLVLGLLCALVAGCGGAEEQPHREVGAVPVTTEDRARADGLALTIPELGIERTPLWPVGLNDDRTVTAPPVEQPEQAAVYSGGPMPGEVGPAVVLGHVNGGGRPGVFARLAELDEGDEIVTTGPDGAATRFVVYRALTVPKADFPTAQVYSDTAGPELRLITCGGTLDRSARSYVGQVVIFARRA